MVVNISVFIIILTLIKFVFANDFYKIYNLESDRVCSHKIPFTIKRLTTGSANAIIVRENTYFKKLSGEYEFKCEFEIETGHKEQFPGVFAVIQKLSLRQDPETKKCIDYIGVRSRNKDPVSETLHLNVIKSKKPYRQFCGNLSANQEGVLTVESSNDLSVLGYYSDESEIVQVKVFIAAKPIHNENLQLEIAFTPYTYCRNTWSDFKECGKGKCIKKRAFGDGVVNCPFVGCPDECENSILPNGKTESDQKIKVTLTAVTSIFCSFFLFLGCIWCFRYFEMFCWSANTLLGRAHPVELSPMTVPAPAPSAPPIDSPNSKDLPPAYETLFPER